MLFFGPYRNPGWINPGFAILYFLLGIAATGTGEFIREGVRKSYMVYNYALGNNVLVSQVPALKAKGYLNGDIWPKALIMVRYPRLVGDSGAIADSAFAGLPSDDRAEIGRVIFQHHCNDCHSERGFSGIAELRRGWNRDMIHTVVTHLDKAHFFMPPWSGTEKEATVLTDYITTLSAPGPPGMKFSRIPDSTEKPLAAQTTRKEK
ncbi:MAG: cytochrome c [Bacteroidetes bacterium]|nr:cytochrome c [Bacteroidota bacterium]